MRINLHAKLSAYTKGILPTKLSELDNDLKLSDFENDLKLSNFENDLKVSDFENDANYVSDVENPQENVPYIRMNGTWVDAESALHGKDIVAGPGIKVEDVDRYTVKISANEWTGTPEEFDVEISEHGYDPDRTYNIIENTPDLYVNGGTSFTGIEEGNNFEVEMDGGIASISQFDIELKPINSKGVAND